MARGATAGHTHTHTILPAKPAYSSTLAKQHVFTVGGCEDEAIGLYRCTHRQTVLNLFCKHTSAHNSSQYYLNALDKIAPWVCARRSASAVRSCERTGCMIPPARGTSAVKKKPNNTSPAHRITHRGDPATP